MKDDTISRAAALDALDRLEYTPGEWVTNGLTMCKDAIKALPPASFENHDKIKSYSKDTISRQAAIETVKKHYRVDNDLLEVIAYEIEALPHAQPGQRNARVFQGIVVEYPSISVYPEYEGKPYFSIKYTVNGQKFIGYGTYKPEVLSEYLKEYFMPSAQPERTCVNCGRTVNNGGWYADGGTRCPIEEHYALPKDGYCHLWEKRNVTDDNYPERREE